MQIDRRQLLSIPLLLFTACEKARSNGRNRPADAAGAQRVVSLSPGTTEAVFAMNSGNRLVGRSRYCDFPAAAKELPSVGGFIDPSLEAILGLSPDLVIGVMGPGGPKIAEQLGGRGIASYFPPTDTLQQIQSMVRGLGVRFAAATDAQTVVARIAQQQKVVENAVRGRKRPRAVFLFGLRPIVVAGRGGFADEVLRLAGAENAVTAGRYPTLGIEQVIALDPDVLVDATGASGHAGETVNKDTTGFRELRAVKEDRLISVRDDRVLRPGPRIGEGLMVLARALHPGISLRAVP
jgi:iron complex transport system substrate-binding protein